MESKKAGLSRPACNVCLCVQYVTTRRQKGVQAQTARTSYCTQSNAHGPQTSSRSRRARHNRLRPRTPHRNTPAWPALRSPAPLAPAAPPSGVALPRRRPLTAAFARPQSTPAPGRQADICTTQCSRASLNPKLDASSGQHTHNTTTNNHTQHTPHTQTQQRNTHGPAGRRGVT